MSISELLLYQISSKLDEKQIRSDFLLFLPIEVTKGEGGRGQAGGALPDSEKPGIFRVKLDHNAYQSHERKYILMIYPDHHIFNILTWKCIKIAHPPIRSIQICIFKHIGFSDWRKL